MAFGVHNNNTLFLTHTELERNTELEDRVSLFEPIQVISINSK